jgi:hypothetical protein
MAAVDMTPASIEQIGQRLRALPSDELALIVRSQSHTREAREVAYGLLVERGLAAPPIADDSPLAPSLPDGPATPEILGFALAVLANVVAVLATWELSHGFSMFLVGLYQVIYIGPLVIVLYRVRRRRVARGVLVGAGFCLLWGIGVGIAISGTLH